MNESCKYTLGVSSSVWLKDSLDLPRGMDPESGVTGLPAPGTTGVTGRTEKEENVVQHVIHVLLEKLKTLFEVWLVRFDSLTMINFCLWMFVDVGSLKVQDVPEIPVML